MKAPKKSVKKPVAKGKTQETDNSKKTKLKPVSTKETKNWKNKLDDEDDDLGLDPAHALSKLDDGFDEADEEFEHRSSSHAFDDHFDDEEDRY